ncbi:hypothetical protein ACIG56_22620 [Nocardia fusca]|uniref:hypothetical protein n=1 Tax=Nocardia fusca TaxID=941183 RepID=UPI0037CAAEFE
MKGPSITPRPPQGQPFIHLARTAERRPAAVSRMLEKTLRSERRRVAGLDHSESKPFEPAATEMAGRWLPNRGTNSVRIGKARWTHHDPTAPKQAHEPGHNQIG